MTERQWWSRYVRKALHQPEQHLIALKAEDKFKTGTPDVDCMFDGTATKIELKFVKRGEMSSRRASELLSPSQRVWIESWDHGRGAVLLLVGVEETKIAHLYNATKLVFAQNSKVATFTWSAKVNEWGLEAIATNIDHWLREL